MSTANEQAERREIILNDSYHRRAKAEAVLDPAVSVVGGAGSAAVIPPLPPTSPFACDPVGLEPPLGVDVHAMNPVGTAAEIEASAPAHPKEALDAE